jgi:hypothetical protein
VGPTVAQLAQTAGFDADKLAAAIDGANRDRPQEQQLSQGPFYSLGPAKTWVLVAPVWPASP